MNKDRIDQLFDRIFPEAVRDGVQNIALPSADVVDTSWDLFRKKLQSMHTTGNKESKYDENDRFSQ